LGFKGLKWNDGTSQDIPLSKFEEFKWLDCKASPADVSSIKKEKSQTK
jgi:hypothetical protein